MGSCLPVACGVKVSNEHDEPRYRILTRERAVNDQYQKELRELVARQPSLTAMVSTTRNERWAGGGPRAPIPADLRGSIVGRVGLKKKHPDLGTTFYISVWRSEFGDPEVQVVSWAAPVASLFYGGRNPRDATDYSVIGRRTFVTKDVDILDFVDDIEAPATDVGDPFGDAIETPLAVPRREGRGPRPQRPVHRPVAETETEASESVPGSGKQPAEVPVADGARLRAEPVVRRAVEQPRTGQLHSVLSTLQADQYHLVTWPETTPLVVQGPPGTGKTIVATHRAVFLTHPQREAGPLTRVVLIGPTPEYAHHVRGVVDELRSGADALGSMEAERDVQVVGLPDLLARLAGLDRVPDASGDERLDTDWRLGRLLERAAAELRKQDLLSGSRSAQVRTLVTAVIAPSKPVEQFVRRDAELARWLTSLRSWEQVISDGRYLPFLAAAGLAVTPPGHEERFDHLLVDEAQDVRPLEWRIIDAFRRPEASMSLFGDVNQRRSDWSSPSWQQLVVDLELGDEHFEPEVLAFGYRTTGEILEFAGALLPRGERKIEVLRSGPVPDVRRVGAMHLTGETLDAAIALAERHRDGLVAVITMQPRTISDVFRRRGWARSTHRHGWTSEGMNVVVLHPTNARGLEFDAVVVVEPGDFPENVGRHGQLYTSLTRATRELCVIHTKKLPGKLRAPR